MEKILEAFGEVVKRVMEPFTTRIMDNVTPYLDINGNLQILKEKLPVLTDRASDIETKVKNAELSGKKRKRMEVQSWLENVKKSKQESETLHAELQQAGFYKRLRKGNHVKELKDGVEELLKQSETFHDPVLDECETSRKRLFTTELHGEMLNQELGNIFEWLEAKSNQVPSIGIYGMGGVGKTFLARHIYNHIHTHLQDTHDKFHVYWVTVSQETDTKKLQHDLARELKVDLSKNDDSEIKAATLHERLIKMKNVVLIFDDVWKFFDLRKVGIPLGVDGCRVIITSRSQDVCNEMRCRETKKVPPLSDEDSWKLFLEKLDCDKLSPEVEEIAKTMAKKCAGLPLAIITVARSMAILDDIHEWRDALEELDSMMGQNNLKSEVLPILQYSYNHLRDPRLQQCFLYCSLYPEDHKIPRDELISLFICEGLMHQRGSRAAEFDQGQALLNRLVKICLLESVVDWDGQKCVKMHDLLREMAVGITRNKPRFMIEAGVQLDEVPNEQVWTEDLDKVSLMYNEIVEIPEGLSPRCHRLSTLILSYNYQLKFIPDSLFAHMHGLRVLNLSFNFHIETLPNSISELENLIALLLGSCERLCYVPSLRKLKTLMELDISRTGIKKVPEGMECLVKLKCLNMQGADELKEIPRRLLPRLPRLQRLLLPFHFKVQSKEVESLKLLEEFEGWVDDVDIFYSKWFNKSPPLTFYKIRIGGSANNSSKEAFLSYERIVEREITTKTCYIISEGCNFKRGGGDVVPLPRNIQCLQFIKCKGLSSCLLEDVPSLYNSKDFRFCEMKECGETECIMRISSASNGDGPLQNLEYLYLKKLSNLIGLIKWEPGALAPLPPRGTFSSLKELEISDCHKMKKLFPHKLLVHNLQNLEVIEVTNCDQMEEIIADDEEDETVGSTSSSSGIAFPMLTTIRLWSLSELYSICKGEFICCDSIKEIKIKGCPKLKRLPLFHPSPSASSSYSPSSNSRSNDNNQYTNITTFPKLREISLFELPELESIYEGTINCCDSIEEIDIHECPKLKRLPLFHPSPSASSSYSPSSSSRSNDNNQYTNITTFPKLTSIFLSSLPELESIYEGTINCCDSIAFISINNCSKIKRLPLFYPSVDEKPPHPSVPSYSSSSSSSSSMSNNNNQYTNIIAFPKLSHIRLSDLPELESIYEGSISCCDSIEKIYISNCPKIKRLPLFYPPVDEKPTIPFPKLREILLFSLPELESIYEGTINCCDSIQFISINNCPKIKRLPLFYPSVDEKSTIPFPKLKELDLWNLPQVKSICNGIMICDSINHIKIRECRQLSRLPLHLSLIDGQPSPPLSLEKIWISGTEEEWWESLEWDHPNSINVLRPFLFRHLS